MAIPPSGKTEMIAANRARAAANRKTNGKKDPPTRGKGGVEKTDNTLRYPYAMLDDNTDYLRIQIADYKPPGLNLDNGIRAKDAEGKDVTKDTKIKSIDIDNKFLNFAAQIRNWKYKKLKFSNKTKYLLIFGDSEKEKYHMSKMPKGGNIKIMVVKNCDHRTAIILKKRGKLKKIINDFFSKS